MKTTCWERLDPERAEVLSVCIGGDGHTISKVQVRHPDISTKRVRWFQRSPKGGWYTRYTRSSDHAQADGAWLDYLPVEDLQAAFTVSIFDR